VNSGGRHSDPPRTAPSAASGILAGSDDRGERLPSEGVHRDVQSGRRTALWELTNRRVSPISDQITTEVSAPMPYSHCSSIQPRWRRAERDELGAQCNQRIIEIADHPQRHRGAFAGWPG
jgi:hypothetical protein